MDLVIKELKQLIPLKVFLGSKARKAVPGKSKQLLAAGASLFGELFLSLPLSVFLLYVHFLEEMKQEGEGGERNRQKERERERVRRGERGRRVYNLHQINVQIPPTPLNLQARLFHSWERADSGRIKRETHSKKLFQ